MSEFDARFQQLRQRFIVRAEQDRKALLGALADERMHEVRSTAHGLSGSAGTFGFAAISALAEEVESAVDQGVEIDILRERAAPLLEALVALQPL